MHRISMETENNKSNTDVMIMHDKQHIKFNNIVLRTIFTSIRYQAQEYIAFIGILYR